MVSVSVSEFDVASDTQVSVVCVGIVQRVVDP